MTHNGSYLLKAVLEKGRIYHTPKRVITKIKVDTIYINPPYRKENESVER